MSKTALNLLAIAIFGISMGILLGPLLGIPEIVPAGITAGLLGAATLDRFSFDNQGTTLLLDWFAQRSPEYRDRILKHEAGHFLVAHLLGIPVTGYALTAWEARQQGCPGQGGVRFDDQAIQAEIDTGQLSVLSVDRYCQMWMAGGAAEKLLFDRVEGGVDDVLKVRSLLRQLQLSEQDIEQKERWAAFQARQTLERHRAAYDALVLAMEQRADLATCQAAIQSSSDSI